jgi:hypothetical protein
MRSRDVPNLAMGNAADHASAESITFAVTRVHTPDVAPGSFATLHIAREATTP